MLFTSLLFDLPDELIHIEYSDYSELKKDLENEIFKIMNRSDESILVAFQDWDKTKSVKSFFVSESPEDILDYFSQIEYISKNKIHFNLYEFKSFQLAFEFCSRLSMNLRV